MPQLDPTFYISQIFWLGVSFALLYILMQFWALPNVTKVIDKRAKTIEDDLKHAEQLQAEIERLTQTSTANMKQAKSEASHMIKTAIAEMRSEHHAQEQELATKLQSHLKTAEEKVQAAQAEALKQVEEASINLAEDMVKRLTHKTLDTNLIQSEVKAAIGN